MDQKDIEEVLEHQKEISEAISRIMDHIRPMAPSTSRDVIALALAKCAGLAVCAAFNDEDKRPAAVMVAFRMFQDGVNAASSIPEPTDGCNCEICEMLRASQQETVH